MLGMSTPEVPELPAEEMTSKTKELLEPLPETYKETLGSLQEKWNSHDKTKDFEVKSDAAKSTVLGVIKGGSSDDDAQKSIKAMAGKMLAKGKFSEDTAKKVWETVEPKIDEQKKEGIPDMAWNKVKGIAQGKCDEQVSKQIETAVDQIAAKANV